MGQPSRVFKPLMPVAPVVKLVFAVVMLRLRGFHLIEQGERAGTVPANLREVVRRRNSYWLRVRRPRSLFGSIGEVAELE